MLVIKRNSSEVIFDKTKITNALNKANKSVSDDEKLSDTEIQEIAESIENYAKQVKRALSVDEINDKVVDYITNYNKSKLVANYVNYKKDREFERKQTDLDKKVLALIKNENEELKQENSNKDPKIVSVMRDYLAGEVSKDITEKYLLPPEIVKAHKEGLIHFHDTDYFAQPLHNCELINLEDMLQNGTCISGVSIDKPKSFQTACTLTSQIVAQVASSQYGGQTITLSHLAPFVDVSRRKIKERLEKEFKDLSISVYDSVLKQLVEKELLKEISDGVQTLQYQFVTLQTTNGQAPFISVNMYLNEVEDEQTKADLAIIIEEVLKQRIQGVKNEQGFYVTPAFPKLLYVLQEDNIKEGTKYFYLTQLAAKCSAKRLVPDYISEKKMKEYKDGDCYPCMGCRAFLTPSTRYNNSGVGNIAKAKNYQEGKPKYYGRFNQGVVTLNLVDVALSSKKDMNKFWEIMDERMELCYQALMVRHNRLKGTLSDVAPILWQHGALARLQPGEVIDPLLYDGYSTLSIGYAGLAECVRYMTDQSHTQDEGKEFGLKVMQYLNDKSFEWKAKDNIDFSVYGTPIESTTYKFAKCLQKRFGVIKDITDKGYITNSYHICVREEIDAFSKLLKEAEFQRLSPGGAISYVEVPNMQNNIEAMIALIQFIYDNTMYAEVNSKSDFCCECHYDGEIVIDEDENGKLIWKCPKCGNTDQSKMSVARRTCGYIGTQFWNQGRTQEIKERVLHL